MKLLIDLQGCQTMSRLRGIGRYSLSLVRALLANQGDNEIVLLANGALIEGLENLRAEFSILEQQGKFVVFDVETSVAEHDQGNSVRSRLAELVRERLVAQIGPDAVLLTSLFEGFVDDAVTSIGACGGGPLTAVTLYDLIPLLNPDPDWPVHYRDYYARKIDSLKRADLLLSISDYAREEAMEAIPELREKVVSMSSACEVVFCVAEVSQERKASLFARLGIKGGFVMSSGTLEWRKNLDALVSAFAALPESLRRNRQLVLVGDGSPDKIASLRVLAGHLGMAPSQLVITGHISNEDLVDLYRTCDLFVFPSLHEGFGLPPLEAMSCGAVVIGSRATSVPEVVGREDALFDPQSLQELTALMARALSDEGFRASLKTWGAERARAFSWNRTAKTALQAIAEAVEKRKCGAETSFTEPPKGRPRLAMISPLPPEQTGIADYLAELLPALSAEYDVTVISDQEQVLPGPHGEVFVVETIAWFETHADLFDRCVYQFGNSPFHAHMLDLAARYPGVVVLHDFFVSSLKLWKEMTGYRSDAFCEALVDSHGYGALRYLEQEGPQAAKFRWPCSFSAISRAQAVIVHSEYSRKLVANYCGDAFLEKVSVVRQHRAPVGKAGREAARARLGVAADAFLVCAFGFVDPTKLNHLLLDAWAASSLACDVSCHLVFVGGGGDQGYSQRIDEAIAKIDGGARIRITGFASPENFSDYLAAADAAVQLRTMSRGETSRTVLDCLAYGTPLVINAHGPMDEYPADVLVKLPDEFEVAELTDALQKLRADAAFRKSLTLHGGSYIRSAHSPAQTVRGYVDVIERVAGSVDFQGRRSAIRRFWRNLPALPLDQRDAIARKLSDLALCPRRPALYIDISATARNDLRTGIERVARALLNELMLDPPAGYQVIPVYLTEEAGRWRVRRAATWLSKQPGFSLVSAEDHLVLPAAGDYLVALDLYPDAVVSAAGSGLYAQWRAAGAQVGFMIHDVLPITHPEFFPSWAPATHRVWLEAVVAHADILVCISHHVASEVRRWMDKVGIPVDSRPSLGVSYHGADLVASLPTTGFPEDAPLVLDALRSRPTFLMVGTIEPRKGHMSVLCSFAELWSQGVEINLVIVGHEGWKALPDEERRTIPQIMAAIHGSPEKGLRLFWLEGISDEYLEKVYAASACLIAASEDEGYGLPLIEAFRHGIPVLARDIPVFREVGGSRARYFSSQGKESLTDAVIEMAKKKSKKNGGAQAKWLSWRESAHNLSTLICKE